MNRGEPDEEMEKVAFKDFKPELPIKEIEVAEENVRQTERESGLEDLKASIQRFGLIHPVIVIQKGEHQYSLIVGQRRLLAFRELGRETIPALVIEPIESTAQEIVSFGENIHRRELPYDDTIRVCDMLFRQFSGDSLTKVRKVAEVLSISPSTVSKYLSYRLVPDEVQHLVEAKKLPPKVAYRITTAYFPNTEKIVEIAKSATKMTKPEWDKTVELAKKKPDASVQEIVAEARKPSRRIDVVISMEPETVHLLENQAKQRGMDVPELIKSIIDDWLKGGKP